MAGGIGPTEHLIPWESIQSRGFAWKSFSTHPASKGTLEEKHGLALRDRDFVMTTTQEHPVSFSDRHGEARMEFSNPPVAETSLGFYFQKIDGWNVLHHGALWERFRSKYPDYEFLPLVIDVQPQGQPGLTLNLSSPPLRVGFVDKTKTQLVQMQDNFFLHNWRKTSHVLEYQRYETVKAQLREDWNILQSYLQDSSLKQPAVARCQMDYFNHLVRGVDWQDFADLPGIFTVWRGVQQSTASGELQTVSFNLSYRLASGTVNVAVQPAIRTNDGKEIIQFTLSSSVASSKAEGEGLFASLDECHANAALAFLDFTTDRAREKWRQKE
jgi:uncharacterized protein (TIGR04255 family)